MILLVLPKFLGTSGANYAKNLLRASVLVQYIPRLYRFLPLLAGQSPSGFIFESAWANFVINLLTFMLSGHTIGSCWYLFGLQVIQGQYGYLAIFLSMLLFKLIYALFFHLSLCKLHQQHIAQLRWTLLTELMTKFESCPSGIKKKFMWTSLGFCFGCWIFMISLKIVFPKNQNVELLEKFLLEAVEVMGKLNRIVVACKSFTCFPILKHIFLYI